MNFIIIFFALSIAYFFIVYLIYKKTQSKFLRVVGLIDFSIIYFIASYKILSIINPSIIEHYGVITYPLIILSSLLFIISIPVIIVFLIRLNHKK